MPNQPKTPLRNVRISDALWDSAKQKAADEGRTVSEVMRELLEKYVQNP